MCCPGTPLALQCRPGPTPSHPHQQDRLPGRVPTHKSPLPSLHDIILAFPACCAVQEVVGVVIVDHGSRKKASNDMLHEFGALYQRLTGRAIVEVAHMEIAPPTIADAIGTAGGLSYECVVQWGMPRQRDRSTRWNIRC